MRYFQLIIGLFLFALSLRLCPSINVKPDLACVQSFRAAAKELLNSVTLSLYCPAPSKDHPFKMCKSSLRSQAPVAQGAFVAMQSSAV